MSRKRSIGENGRQIKGNNAQPILRKPSSRSIFIDTVREEIFYRWRFRQWTERSLAATYGVSREHIEGIIRAKLTDRDNPRPSGPAAVRPIRPIRVELPEKKAA